ncbi:DUF2946 family protein [Pontivivens ytuae]|uniref:DUF2946 domain-containing protein n=1 Tax=Pontivivens ytuae TaxID=2789856 RepID=A0A7S9QCP2_9RHOB|nr:DUF2946 family protein [Pontivivens ytuae]QPH54438.1 hypothetical protein I0K15_01245 [Pontivivens ytuae]
MLIVTLLGFIGPALANAVSHWRAGDIVTVFICSGGQLVAMQIDGNGQPIEPDPEQGEERKTHCLLGHGAPLDAAPEAVWQRLAYDDAARPPLAHQLSVHGAPVARPPPARAPPSVV